MKTIQLIQGTPEWHAHRGQHFNASDAPAMLGCSAYKSRAQLLRELATGAVAEIDDSQQGRFDDGHRAEALARPLAEAIIGEELYPCVGVSDDGKLSASFDGLTLMGDVASEHKMLNADLRTAMVDGCTGADLPKPYRVQMEQQALVSGADRVLFMASTWSGDELVEERHCWYTPDPALRDEILTGWKQFEQDLAVYEAPAHVELLAPGRAPDQLPALRIEVTGMVTASNLAEWKDRAIAVFQSISTDLNTDQDFADAEKTVKWCGDIEDQLKAAKQHALSQTASIDELFRTIDAISEQARAKRLDLDKRVKSRKEERRTEIGNAGRRAVIDHVRSINDTLGEHAIAMPPSLVADLTTAMKGKKSFASMQDAIDSVVTAAKIASSQQAERVRANITTLAAHPEHATLFADRVQLCASKAPDDLRNLVAARIAEHEQREAERLERERARIRQEEADKLQREQAQHEAAPAAAASAAASAPPARTAVQSTPASTPAIAAVSSDKRIKLGDINSWIAPLSITADGLAALGYKPVGTQGAAKLYAANDLAKICDAMIETVRNAPLRAAEKSAA